METRPCSIQHTLGIAQHFHLSAAFRLTRLLQRPRVHYPYVDRQENDRLRVCLQQVGVHWFSFLNEWLRPLTVLTSLSLSLHSCFVFLACRM